MTYLIRLISISFILLFSFSIQSCSKVEKEITNSIGMKFVYIKPGTFMMGIKDDFKTKGIEGYKKEYIKKGFYLQTTETTVGQWRKFIEETGYVTEAEVKPKNNNLDEIDDKKEIIVFKSNTSFKEISAKEDEFIKEIDGYCWKKLNFKQTDSHPVTLVSKYDVYQFIKWLNKKEGRYYRLPTEAEWEYAARAGSKTHLPNGDLNKEELEFTCKKSILDKIGWYCFNSKSMTHPVGLKLPNSWGLFDMNGNVWEYVEDKFHDELDISISRCEHIRGGAWDQFSSECISGRIANSGCNIRKNTYGFRLVRDVRKRK